MKIAITLAFLALATSAAFAQRFNSVAIQNYDGTTHRIAIDGDSLSVSLNGNAIRLSNSGITVEYDIPEVKHFEFEYYKFAEEEYYLGTKNDLSQSRLTQAPLPTIAFKVEGDRLLVSGLGCTGRAVLFGVTGSEVASAPVTELGTAAINIGSLGHGAYILNTGGKSFKISF